MPTYTTKTINVTFTGSNGDLTPVFSDYKLGNDGEHLNTLLSITLPSAWSVFINTNPVSYVCVEYVNAKGKSGRSSNISIPNPIGTVVTWQVPRDALFAPETAMAFTVYQDIDGVSTRLVKSNVVRCTVGEGFTAGAVANPYGHDIIQQLLDLIDGIETSALQLGETNTTAYRGDRGKTAYDHSQIVTGNPHNLDKTDIGLGNVDNTSDLNKPISTATQTSLDNKLDKNFTGFTNETALLDSDVFAINKSEGTLKKSLFSLVKSTLKTYFDGLYTAKNVVITGATKTKITYDSKGLVTAGANATTNDIPDSADKRYVTDSEQIAITHTNRAALDAVSGVNTGDQDLSGKMDVDGLNSNVDTLQFDLTPTGTFNIGGVRWNDTDKCLEVKTGTNTVEQINQEQVIYATNKDIVNIDNGKAVYISGATGETPSIKLAGNITHTVAQATIGVATDSISVNGKGKVTTQGLVRGINTNAWNEGDQLFLGTNGSLTTTIPTAPTTKVFMGVVTKKSAGSGEIFVYVLAVNNLTELSDVHAPTVAGGDILKWNATNSRWEVFGVDTALSGKIAKTTDVTAINDANIADGEIAVFNKTNKDIRTSDKTIVTTLGSDDTTVPTSKAVKDVTDTFVKKDQTTPQTFVGNFAFPTVTTASVGNTTSLNNAKLEFLTTGAKLTRDVADSNSAFIVNQQNASSTGDIFKAQFNGSDKFNIKSDGKAGIGTTTPLTFLEVAIESTSDTPIASTAYTSSGSGFPGMVTRSARGTKASPTSTQANDNVLFFGARGFATSAFTTASVGAIAIKASENFSDTARGTYITFETTLKTTTTRAEKMRLDDAGNLGIGTTTPDTKLQVVGDTKLGDDNTNFASFSTTGRLSYAGSARKSWTKYTANSVTLTAGTSAQTVTALQTMNDGTYYSITEAAATPGINLIVDFVSVTAFEKCRILGEYVGSTTHAVACQLYNWTTTNWDTFNAMQNGYADIATANGIILNNYEFTCYDDTNYIGTGGNAGKVRVRLYHTMAGNASHNLYLDEVSLRQ